MSDESVVKHLEQPQVGTLKLSEAIRIGCPEVKESRLYTGCALAAGYYAKTGRQLVHDVHDLGYAHHVAQAFGIPTDVAIDASLMHLRGVNREGVADWLESLGY
jgi:hypothetical protein